MTARTRSGRDHLVPRVAAAERTANVYLEQLHDRNEVLYPGIGFVTLGENEP
jgi:hypothetical protein